ncbi:MAG: type II toxin-antitoxin system Phd/YefM family antitoxin [Verrucomicrobiota bacterium]
MQTISSNTAKQSLGTVLQTAQHEPVLIEKHTHPTAVILSVAEYDRLKSGRAPARKAGFPSQVQERAALAAKSLPVVRKSHEGSGTRYSPMEMVELVKLAEFGEGGE